MSKPAYVYQISTLLTNKRQNDIFLGCRIEVLADKDGGEKYKISCNTVYGCKFIRLIYYNLGCKQVQKNSRSK